MTVPTTAAFTGPYFPNGVTVEYPFGFKVNSEDEVALVYIEDDGSETIVPPADYTVVLSSNENNPGGTVTTANPLAAGTRPLYVALEPVFTQNTKFEDEGAFNQSILNPTFDAGALRSIWLRSRIERAFIAPFGEVGLTLPRAAARANYFFSFGADGSVFLSPGTGADAGLRQALAQPNALALLPAVDLALQGKAPVSTKSPAIDANLYPVDFRLGRDHPPHPFEFIPANQQAAIVAGSTIYDAADDLQKMVDGWTPDQGKAGVIEFPDGVFSFGKTILFPNWVSWRGQGRGTQLFALAGHAGPYMFQFDSDPDKALGGTDPILDPSPQSRFNQRLEAFDINPGMDQPGRENLTRIIYAPSWNEKCGLRDVMARNVGCTFLYVDEWHGGSAGFQITDLEVFFTAGAYTAGVVGISLNGIARGGGLITNRPQVTLRNVTMAGATAGVDDANPGLVMIEVDNMHVQLLGGIHFERAQIGIDVQRDAMLTGFGLTGSDVAGRVVNLIYRSGSHVGRIDLRDIYKGSGGIKEIHDAVSGIHRSTSVGNALSVPSLPGEAWASGRFKVAGAAVTESQLLGCSGVIRDGATGYYRVTHDTSMVSGDNYTVVAEAHDDTARCKVESWPTERVGATFHLRCYRITDNTLFDPKEITFRVYRKPGL